MAADRAWGRGGTIGSQAEGAHSWESSRRLSVYGWPGVGAGLFAGRESGVQGSSGQEGVRTEGPGVEDVQTLLTPIELRNDDDDNAMYTVTHLPHHFGSSRVDGSPKAIPAPGIFCTVSPLRH